MEKYAVETEKQDNVKQASERACPICGGKLTSESNVSHCSSCGTKPFETKK